MPRPPITLFSLTLCCLAAPLAAAQEPLSSLATPPMTSDVSPERQPLTLVEAYALALKQSETIAIKGEVLKETEGRFLQALAGALPQVSFKDSEKRQDGTGSSSFTLRNIPERKFTFSQPLFSGFKEFAAMAGARAEHRERVHDKARAEQLLLIDVANAFYLLLKQRETLNAYEVIRLALIERIDELDGRERLGRSRRSERVSAEVQVRRTLADVEAVRRDEALARKLLAFLIGRDPAEGVVAPASSLPPLDDLSTYVAKADHRSDVLAAEEAWHVTQKQVAIAHADFWPNVSAEGNYYTKRVGVAQNVKWDVLLMVDVPLFQGGKAVGAAREASAKEREAKLELARVRRAASLEIQDAYEKLRVAMKRAATLEQAVASAEENYRLQRDDYRLSLVNNLEVLQALQSLQDTRLDLIAARYEAKRLYWELRTATGETL